MYKVEVNSIKKMVKIELKGFIKSEEMNEFAKEFRTALKRFGPKEALILGDMSDFKPASPEVVSIMQGVLKEGTIHCKKAASVHKSAIAQMQLKRAGEESQANDVIKRFKTEEEAIEYLLK